MTGLTDLSDDATMHGGCRLVDFEDVCGANANAAGHDTCWLCAHISVRCRQGRPVLGKIVQKIDQER